MKYFINKNGEILSYKYYEGQFSLYNREEIIFSSNTKLKNICDVVEPIYHNNYLILFDYDRGVEIISKDSNNFLKIRAVINAEIFDNILMLNTNKKIIFIDYLKLEIIDQYNVSENFELCRVDYNILMYRVKKNKSYLYNIKSKKIFELSNLPILDIMINKFILSENILHIFFSHGYGDDQNSGVIEYDIISSKYIKKDFGPSSAYGFQFIDYFNPIINNKIEIDENNYENFIISLIKKYGLLIAFYFVDENKILHIESFGRTNIKECFMDYKSIIQRYNQIKSFDDFDNFKQELLMLEIEFKNGLR